MFKRLAVLLLLPAAALADVEFRYSDGTFGLVRDGHVLFGDDSDAILFQPGSNTMIAISHEERSWMRLEPGFVEDMAAQMQAQMDQMLAGMPPEQRAMVEAQMKDMMPQLSPQDMPKMSLSRTGETDEIAGYDCDIAEISYDDGTVEETVCIADPGELGLDDADFEALVSAMQGIAELASIAPGAAPQADFGAMGGVPIRTSAGPGETSEIVSVDTSPVDASRLAVPEGYRELSMEDMMGQ